MKHIFLHMASREAYAMTVCNAELLFRDVLLRDMLTVPIQDIEQVITKHSVLYGRPASSSLGDPCKLKEPTMLLQILFANTA